MTPAEAEFLLARSHAFGQLFDTFAAEHGLVAVDFENWPAADQAALEAAQEALTAEWRAKAKEFTARQGGI